MGAYHLIFFRKENTGHNLKQKTRNPCETVLRYASKTRAKIKKEEDMGQKNTATNQKASEEECRDMAELEWTQSVSVG